MSKRLRTESLSVTAASNGDQMPIVPAEEPAVHTPKYASVEPEDVAPSPLIECLLPPHKPLSFTTYDAYESHYNQAHTNRCSECKNNLPTSHFLDLHISECHDPILASKKAAGEKTYACFVEGCDKVCRDWRKRRCHLVDKHGYPKNYDFLVVNHGIDGRRSMLRPGVDADGHRKSSRERRKSNSTFSGSTQTTEAASVDEDKSSVTKQTPNATRTEPQSSQDSKGAVNGHLDVVDDLTSSMSALKMVPRSITFGKRKGRAGFARS